MLPTVSFKQYHHLRAFPFQYTLLMYRNIYNHIEHYIERNKKFTHKIVKYNKKVNK